MVSKPGSVFAAGMLAGPDVLLWVSPLCPRKQTLVERVATSQAPKTIKKPRLVRPGLSFSYVRRSSKALLTDADINRSPRPSSRRDIDPGPSGTAIPVGQEYPIAVPEAAETEMTSVLEEVAAHYAVMVVAAFTTFAVIEVVTVFAFVAVVYFAVVALRVAIIISAVVFIRVHVCRRSVINASCRAVISHTRSARSARAALGTKARAQSTAAARACTSAKAWSTATTSMRSNAATASAATTTVMALRVSAAR